MRHDLPATVYVPMAQVPEGQLHTEPLAWVIRTQADPNASGATIAKALLQTSRGLPVTQIRSMDVVLTDSTAATRFQTALMVIFGGSALVLATLGLYGVTSYAVARRRREIGIRMALGAAACAVIEPVMLRAALLVGAGIVIGAIVSAGASKFVASMLYGVEPRDPVTFVGAAAILAAVGAVAGWLPARRASRIDPAEVPREV